MCQREVSNRIQTFIEVNNVIKENKFLEIKFHDNELLIYRAFSESLDNSVSRIGNDCSYFDDSDFVQKKLEDLYQNVMLEEYCPSNNFVIRCFLNGQFYYSKNRLFLISELKQFVEFLRSCSKDKKNIILNNIYTRLDATERYPELPTGFNDDVPF